MPSRGSTFGNPHDPPPPVGGDAKSWQELFAPLLSGRYTGQPATLWRQIEWAWMSDEVVDITMFATERTVDRGSHTEVECLHDAVRQAIDGCDHAWMLMICDQAEESGVAAEVCDLTRKAIDVQYPR